MTTKQQYFEAVKKLSFKTNKTHSLDELQKIAMDLGIGKESWAGLQKEFQDSLMRGKGYMKYNNWDDAIQELKHAEQINPFHLGVLMEMSESYKQLWLKNDSPIDEEFAEQYAKRCLQIQPNHERSLQLISSLKVPASATKERSTNWWRKWVALVIGLFLLGGILVYNVSQPRKVEIIGDNGNDGNTDSTTTNNDIDYGNVKVDFRYDNSNQGLKWLVEDSYFQEFDKAFGYTLKMNVLPQGIELSRLRIKVTLFDENRQEVYSQDERVVDDETYIHDDFIPIVMTLFNEVDPIPKVVSAEVSVIDVKMERLSDLYPVSPKKQFVWGVKRPPNMNIEIRERYSKLSASYNKKSSYHHIILEVKNMGKYPVKELKVGVSWVNHDPKMVDAVETMLVSPSSTTALKPGQRFILDRTFEVKGYTPDMLQSFGISVTELKY
ncbi:MAG: tetratricopeptide repeat protein [Chitinophagales bacterium]